MARGRGARVRRLWMCLLPLAIGAAPALADGPEETHVGIVVTGTLVQIRLPDQVLVLDSAAGLRGVSWENRRTGRKLSLGRGREVELEVGQPGAPRPVKLEVVQLPRPGPDGPAGFPAVFVLSSREPSLKVTLTYLMDERQPVLRKLVQVANTSGQELQLLNVRLGNYPTDAVEVTKPQQGFPVYLDNQFFISLAHPSGWATVEDKNVALRHYPGVKLAPGREFNCMEAVYGVCESGRARAAFTKYVASRMRRVLRGHDKPYAIFEPFGARPGGNFRETEQFLLDSIAKVAAGARQSGAKFDYYLVDFWQDVRGDLIRFDPGGFPNGFEPIKKAIAKAGMLPGLWIDSGGQPSWTIGGNPEVRPSFSEPDGRGILCRASEPIKSMYARAFVHHVKENGVRLLKFDNLGAGCKFPVCNNPNHGHLGGRYSLEAIHNSVIDFLTQLDRACPDVFIMLYWGYRSPWWLLHADTYFEPGMHIEGASPSSQPAPYARDSVTQRLDQAQWTCTDVPWLGKDSLGVWLSDWSWNSCVGKTRWQEGFVMDICRGSLLAQIWSDTPWLSPPERRQIADFIALMKANPACFANSRFILGDPWKDEPYGYSCADGKRAFLGIHNACWKDSIVPLKLGAAWGLPEAGSWDLYRWHGSPARLKPVTGEHFAPAAAIALRPFEVVLLEAVPAGTPPSLDRRFDPQPMPTGFAEPTRRIDLTEPPPPPSQALPSPGAVWQRLQPDAAVSAGEATLTIRKDGSVLAGGKAVSDDTYTVSADAKTDSITAILLEVLPDASLPACGPGRAVNGNFQLIEFSVSAAAKGQPGQASPLKLQNPRADFNQTGYGGWPVQAAIDGDPKTGWSIDPEEGTPHVALFEFTRPLDSPGGASLTFKLVMGEREHGIGRFRIHVTAAKTPLPLPKGYGGRVSGKHQKVLTGQVPASAAGGMLVVWARQPGGSAKGAFTCEMRIDGRAVACDPVWSDSAYWGGCWQAWRMEIGPSGLPRPVEAVIRKKTPGGWNWACHFIPK